MRRLLLIGLVLAFSLSASGQPSQAQAGTPWSLAGETFSDDADGRRHLTDVTVRIGRATITADEAVMDIDANQVELRGRVILALPKQAP
jgi:hypothetical protein